MSVVTKETLQHSSWTVITNTGRPLLNIETFGELSSIWLGLIELHLLRLNKQSIKKITKLTRITV